MLPFASHGTRGPLVVALHWLGGSALTWTEVGVSLAELGARCVAIDLPGFGNATASVDFAVAAMAEQAIATIDTLRRQDLAAPWFLMGHSMGGKLTAILARAALDGDERLKGLAGLILVSPSPPGPEPMKEKQREHLLDRLGKSTHDLAEDRARAEAFVDDNVGKLPLPDHILERSAQDVLRMDRAAFVAWLTNGSKEDWSKHVGVITLPSLVLAGTEEPALGPDSQRTHTLPHLQAARLVELVGGGHLGPLERPSEVAARVADFIAEIGCPLEPHPNPLAAGFTALIASGATSPRTREVLNARLEHDQLPRSEYVLDIKHRLTLRALVDRVVPGCSFDLADRLHLSLAQGMQDGWRHDLLPPDLEAWQKGLASLDTAAKHEFSVPFVALGEADRDGLLAKAREGQLGKGLLGSLHLGDASRSFDAEQMQTWFEDVRGELSRLYIADPRTMERIGFTGFADEHGFTQITLGASPDSFPGPFPGPFKETL